MILPVRPTGLTDDEINDLATSLSTCQIELLDHLIDLVKPGTDDGVLEWIDTIGRINELCVLHNSLAEQLNLA
jgi:hypothetical protein